MNILKMTNINKSFYGVKVLDNVCFEVEQGEVHALLGENGAGKSTLMNILGGVYTRDSGIIEFAGKTMHNTTINMAEEVGIAFVHQELNVVNHLKVFESLFLNHEIINKFHKLNKKVMRNKTQELFKDLGVDIDPDELVENLNTGKKQFLEIAKALFADAKLFILDEPTTALNNDEINNLFTIINKLKNSGKSFIFISHKMPEIFTLADRYTVLCNGKYIKTGYIKDTTPEDVTKLMVGETYASREVYEKRNLGENVIELINYSGEGFSNINLSVHRGEVIGFTGLQGAGSSDLIQGIFGLKPSTGGLLKVFNKEIHSQKIHIAMKNKIAMLASNRNENSIIPDMDLLENTYLAEHTLSKNKQHIIYKKELNKFLDLRKRLNIKSNNHKELITNLSGGNQQKVILSRWLNTEAEIFLLDNPTQGIDVGSKTEIYKLILELSKQGKTIIVNTLEIPEIQRVADRCVVFYHGKIQIILDRQDITEEKVMLYATNAILNLEVQND